MTVRDLIGENKEVINKVYKIDEEPIGKGAFGEVRKA